MRKRTLLILAGSILVIALVLIGVISPATKYLVEKYDEAYTGRQITMGWVYVNPFTGYIRFSDLKIYESKSDSIFISANSLSVDIALLKLFTKTYEISEAVLNQPRGFIIQNNKELNFSDLIELFSPPRDSGTIRAPVHFNIANIKINDGEFHYQEKLVPVNYFIKQANFESKGKRWDTDTITTHFSFLPGTGSGSMVGDFTINIKTNDYRVDVVAEKFDLKFIQQYINDLSNYGNFSANMDASIRAKGNINDQENINASGRVAINDFHLGKDSIEDYLSFNNLKLVILDLSPKNHQYFFDSVYLDKPYLKYERYDYLDNFQTMFGGGGVNITSAAADPYKFNLVIEVARYIKVLSRNFFQSDYKINSLAVQEGNLEFNDFSLVEQFSANLKPLNIKADSINKNHKRVNATLYSNIRPYGNISVALSINPKDSGEFDMQYQLQKLPAAMFNPYIISSTSFSMNNGTIECQGTWKARNSFISSQNHLVIIDPKLTRRLKNDDMDWVPLPLIIPLIRERGNVVDYDLPISGNLKDPKIHFSDAILDLLENIFVKPPTTEHGVQVRNAELELEKSLSLTWPMRQRKLPQNQEKFIERMAEFLVKNPDASMAVRPQLYEAKEREYMLFFEAKKKFFLLTHPKNVNAFSDSDAEQVDEMSVKDKAFVQYLNKFVNDSMVFTIQEKCARFVDSKIIDATLEKLRKDRLHYFMAFFQKRKVEKQIISHADQTTIPYNGFSYYKIEYKNELPGWLVKAYAEMNQLNNGPRRKKLKNERLENKRQIGKAF